MYSQRWRIATISVLASVLFSVSFVSCTSSSRATLTPTTSASPLPTPVLNAQQMQAQQWIQHNAVPLMTTDPKASLDDLQSLSAIVGTKTLVGLGEATHGTHEFFTMKHRILEYLVEKLGFTTFAIEGSWSAGKLINDYVLNGTGTAADVLAHMEFWTWNTQEVLDLIEWMRAYNVDPSHTVKVHFAGFDCQDIEAPTFQNVESYIQQVDPANSATVQQMYAQLGPTENTQADIRMFIAAYAKLPLATRQQYATQAQQVYTLLTSHQTQDISRSSAEAFANALQDARVIVQTTQYAAFDSTAAAQMINYRDAAMAENIGWLMGHGAGKTVLWAHDGHIGSASTGPGYVTMGMHLRQQFGANYMTILTSFYVGSFNAAPIDANQTVGSVRANTLTTLPIASSYNQVLGSLSTPNYLLDMSKLPATGPVTQWFAGPRGFIEIGAGFNGSSEGFLIQSAYALLALQQAADVIISLQQTTPTQLLPLS